MISGTINMLKTGARWRDCPAEYGPLNDGPSGSRPEEQTWSQTDEATFAKQMTEVLYRMKHSGKFESLVIVADPQTLGQLRDAMHQIVESSIARIIAKDLTNHSVREVLDALKGPVGADARTQPRAIRTQTVG